MDTLRSGMRRRRPSSASGTDGGPLRDVTNVTSAKAPTKRGACTAMCAFDGCTAVLPKSEMENFPLDEDRVHYSP